MASVPNTSMMDSADESRSPANAFQRDQPPIMGQPGLEINDQGTINRTELATNYNNDVGTDTSTVINANDTAVLTFNQLPNPIIPEDVPVSENTNKKKHKKLVLQMSQASQKSNSMTSNTHMPVMRVKSVTTPGGRVVRNINMNNSVKYDISSALDRYSSAFSSYKNVFRPGSVKQDEQQQQQKQTAHSLRRDGQVRRTSRHERTTSDRSMSASSSEDNFVNENKNDSKLTQQMSTDSCTSATSSTQLVTNPYNIVNQKIYSVIWCPCFFFFCFLCSLPAIQFMRRSDKFFDENNYNKARTYARLSTALFILGMVLSIAFVAAIFAVIILFSI